VPETIINLENVSYRYPREKNWALRDINLSIAEGEFLAVMGEDGAGKTTFCKLFNGIIPHHLGGQFLGNVIVDGENTREGHASSLAVKSGIVLDDPDAQLFTTSVRDETAFGPENLLLPADEILKRVEYALSAAGLSDFQKRAPSTLSGGEKQRLSIACALAMMGKVLVLDEPLSRLDPRGKEDFMSVLKEVRRKYQLTVIMAAHESKMIAGAADRVCVLKNGHIADCDTPEKIFANSALLENAIQPPDDADIYAVFTVKNEPPEKDSAICIKDFCYSYRDDGARIENINLSIADNDFTAVIGNNGCGKTTLLKSIAGLLRPCSGDIFIRGKNTKELTVSDISKEAGFVMQNPDTQLFTDSVYDEVSFALKNSDLAKTEIQHRVEEALSIVGLKEADAFPLALSRADRVKTVFASVLAMGSKIIILDEIDSGQDYRGSRNIMNIARELHSRGFTIIFVTHNMSLACEYAHRLIIMERNGIASDKVSDRAK
jgi:energy-coupling factor transport system ATP-binding protein